MSRPPISCIVPAHNGERYLAEAIGELANALETTGRLDEALAAYQRLIEIDPAQVKAQLAVVNLLDGRGDHRGSIESLRRARQSLPDDVDIANDYSKADRNQQ